MNAISELEAWTRANPLLWGLLASIVGFFGKLAFDLYGDPLKRKVEKRRERVKRKLADEKSSAIAKRLSGKHFSFGGVRTSIYVLDLNLEGYPANTILTRKIDFNEAVPAKYMDSYRQHRFQWDAKLEAKEIYEGPPTVVPRRVMTDRAGRNETKLLRFDYSLSESYVHGRAVADLYRALPAEIRAEILRDPAQTMDPHLSQGFGVYLAVITSDSHLAFAQRSLKVNVNPGRMVCGIAELANDADTKDDHFDIYATARRALSEELGVSLQHDELYAIKMIACIFDTEYHAWAMVGVADLSVFPEKYTCEVLVEYTSTAKARDKWEFTELQFVKFEPYAVAAHVFTNADLLIDAAKVTAVYALLADSRNNRASVAEAFKVYGSASSEA